MEDKQAWKRGLITSQLSPLLAHRNVESKGTEYASVLENLILNKNPLGEENNHKTYIAEHHEVSRFLVSAIVCEDKWVFIT